GIVALRRRQTDRRDRGIVRLAILFDMTVTMTEQNYWLTTAEIPQTDRSQSLPESADVAIIGAGFTGLSAARALAKRGANVAVLESETIGCGASSRNGGMVVSGLQLRRNKLVSRDVHDGTEQSYAASL